MPLHCLDFEGEPRDAGAGPSLPRSGFRWLHWDLADPGLAAWAETHLPARAAMALLQRETRPRAFADPEAGPAMEGLVLILRGVNFNPGDKSDDMVSLRVFVSPSLVVSVRVRRVFSVVALREEIERGQRPGSPAELVWRLIEALTDRIEAESLALETRVDALEETALDGLAPDPGELARLRRAAIRMGRFCRPQAVALEQAAGHATDFFQGAALDIRLHDNASRTRRADELLEAARHRLASISDHLDMSQSTRLGRNSYLLSVIAAIFLPLGFLTGVFGVNLGGMPGTASPVAFWILSGAMVLIGIAVAIVLRWLRLF